MQKLLFYDITAYLGINAATMVQTMWQHDTWAFVRFIKEIVDAHNDPGPQSHASDQP